MNPKTNELFVSDGYGNARLMVFGADTGRFKRMWGAYGNTPLDPSARPPRPKASENPFALLPYELQQCLGVTDVEMSQAPSTEELKTALRLDAAGTELTLIKRLRHIDNEPFSYTLNYLPTQIGARVKHEDLYSVPLLKILQDDLKIRIVRARETIEAASADPVRVGAICTTSGQQSPRRYQTAHAQPIERTLGNQRVELEFVTTIVTASAAVRARSLHVPKCCGVLRIRVIEVAG